MTAKHEIAKRNGGKEYVLKADLPGLDKKDIRVEVKGNMLNISGEKKSEKEEKGKDFFRRERAYGAFSWSLPLPEGVKSDKAKAQYKHGVLSLRIPREPSPTAPISGSREPDGAGSGRRCHMRKKSLTPRGAGCLLDTEAVHQALFRHRRTVRGRGLHRMISRGRKSR